MSTLSTPAIVLRTANYRDYDRMLTLLSPEHGRLSALARGCRRPGAKLRGAVQVFQTGQYFFASRQDRLTLTQCELGESYYNLRFNLSALEHASYIANLCEEAAVPGQADPELYQLLLDTLALLNGGTPPPEEVLVHFVVRLMAHLGYRPEVERCLECGREIQGDAAWDAEAGGILCADCRGRVTSRVRRTRLSAQARMRMALMMRTPILQDCRTPLVEGDRAQMLTGMRPFVAERIERYFPSQALLEHGQGQKA
nr:DNA repair protein RecO [bacterium]